MFDPSTDYLVFDGLQSVTYFVRTTEATPKIGGITVNKALRQTTSLIEKERLNLVGKTTVVWHLWGPELTGLSRPPRVGDVIQEASGQRWQSVTADYDTLPQHWKLVCLLER